MRWATVGKVVMNMGEKMHAQGMLYKAVVQVVLLYGSKSWVVTGDMLKVLKGFHQLVAREITGMTLQPIMSGEWEWPPVVT